MKSNKKRYNLPSEYKKNIYEIDYQKLYSMGKKNIVFDLDNTLVDYETHEPSSKLKEFIDKLKGMGFNLVIISNNKRKRVSHFAEEFKILYLSTALKPFSFKLRKFINKLGLKSGETCLIGDQLMTDSKVAHSLNLYMILVDPIKIRTEKWYTRLNRRKEKKLLERINKEDKKIFDSLGLSERWKIMN